MLFNSFEFLFFVPSYCDGRYILDLEEQAPLSQQGRWR